MNLQRSKVVPQRETKGAECRDARDRRFQGVVKFSLNLQNRNAGKGLQRDARTDTILGLTCKFEVIAGVLPHTRARRGGPSLRRFSYRSKHRLERGSTEDPFKARIRVPQRAELRSTPGWEM